MQNITQPRIPHNTLTTFKVDHTADVTTFEIVGLLYRTTNKDRAAIAKDYLMDCLRLDGCQISGVLQSLEQMGIRRI